MMSYNHLDQQSDRCCSSNSTAGASGVSNSNSSQLKLYQFFMFCVPIIFTFVLLLLFYLFYLRPRRVNWSSLGMRTSSSEAYDDIDIDISSSRAEAESGLKKDIREMLPIIVYKESFFVRDTQCSVCLGEYEAEDRLQQIPSCGHTFHIDCIDHWLSNHTTCPLCRLSLLSCAQVPPLPPPHVQVEAEAEAEAGNIQVAVADDNDNETSLSLPLNSPFIEFITTDTTTTPHHSAEENVATSHCVLSECGGQLRNANA